MVAKPVILLLSQAFLALCISSQCIDAGYGPWNAPYITEAPLAAAWAASPCAATPFATAEWATDFAPTSTGGGFQITSASPIGVTGVWLTSENAYEGPLTVTGVVPFLGAVALDGFLPTAGCGRITYSCGNGNIAMMSEGVSGNTPLAYEACIAAPAYSYNTGCDYGAIY